MKVPAAARSISRPPRTLPVKLMKSKPRSAISSAVVAWSRKRLLKRPSGRWAKAWARRSPASGVWLACFSTTALPAISAGTMVLIAVRNG